MLEMKTYSREELVSLLGNASNQGLKRKLERYGVEFRAEGRGNSITFHITGISDSFKMFCMTELNIAANTDFHKLKWFYYYFFNDEEFMAMPDEVKEYRMSTFGTPITRQTIANYISKLEQKNMITRNTKNFIYYFAYKKTQRIVNKEEYLTAWHEYWAEIDDGICSCDAIWDMRAKYGGVARKQAIPEINGIYNEKIEYFISLIAESVENEIST